MSADKDQSIAPPHHFALVLGRGDYPVVAGLTADEVLRRADCRTCKGVIKP